MSGTRQGMNESKIEKNRGKGHYRNREKDMHDMTRQTQIEDWCHRTEQHTITVQHRKGKKGIRTGQVGINHHERK